MAGGRRGGGGGALWKRCCVPLVFWLLSVRGEDRTLLVEVGWMVSAHLREEAALTWMSVTPLNGSAQPVRERVRVCVCVTYSRVRSTLGSMKRTRTWMSACSPLFNEAGNAAVVDGLLSLT